MKYAILAAVVGLFLVMTYLHGEARYKTGYSKAREESARQAAAVSKQHASALAKAIEKTRQQEIAFHAKLKNLQAVKDVTGCLDRPLGEFTERLRDAYPGKR